MPLPQGYLKARAPLLGFAAAAAIASVSLSSGPRVSDEESLKAALGQACDCETDAFVWGKSQGVLTDYLIGRPLLFEGSSRGSKGDAGEVFFSSVRVSKEGRVLSIGTARNLTETEAAHEYGLTGNGSFAMFATEAKLGPQSLTVLSFSSPALAKETLLGRLQIALRNYLSTGRSSGLQRSDLIFSETVPGPVIAKLTNGTLRVSYPGGEVRDETTNFLQQDSGRLAPLLDQAGISLNPRVTTPVPWLHFLADAGRRFAGPGVVAWVEGRTFSLADGLTRATYHASHRAPANHRGPAKTAPPKPTPPPKDQPSWPPPPLTSGLDEGDGRWTPLVYLEKEPVPSFYRTVLHTDAERPYAEIHLVAMDMRRLSLGIGAGYEDPHPDTGPPGSGHLPRDPKIARRVVATFNGAFKATHGRYGMKAEGRVLVPPVEGAASVLIDKRERVGFGTWTREMDQADFLAFRQNLDPLVKDGKPNPSGRKVWGEHLYGAGVAVQRTALCLHETGHLLYAWATEATGEALAQGLSGAGCTYAVHLDMNPGHCAFLLNQVDSVEPFSARGRPLDPRMNVNPTRYVRWSPKDFFYVMKKSSLPHSEGVSWRVAPGDSPSPPNIPGLFFGDKTIAQIPVTIDRVDAGRLAFSIEVGSGEGNASGSLPAPPVRPLIAWGMGHGTRGSRTGLSIGRQVVVPLKRNYASLILTDGDLSLLPPGEPQVEKDGQTVVQLPVLARDGALLPESRELGGVRRRAALCIDRSGSLLIARMEHDTPAPLAQLLVDLGCDLVVDLDRGSHPPSLVERAGTPTPPGTGAEQTRLYGSDTIMRPHTFSVGAKE